MVLPQVLGRWSIAGAVWRVVADSSCVVSQEGHLLVV